MNDQSPDLDLSTSADATRGPLSRRTVLAGTAFAVPAIVLTAGTPALAASGLTLAFDKSSYSGQGCSTITGAKVTAKDGSTAKPGAALTVSLSGGYTFSNGGTTSTGTTDSNGVLSLPDINVPAAGGTSTITATASGSTSASSTLAGTPVTAAIYLDNRDQRSTNGVPGDSSPTNGTQFLAPDGRLIEGNSPNGAVLAYNIAAVGETFVDDAAGTWYLPLLKTDGSTSFMETGMERSTTGVPANSTPMSSTMFLAPDGRVLDGRLGGQALALNVVAFGGIYHDGSKYPWFMPLRKSDGSCSYLDSSQERSTLGVPNGSTPICGTLFLSPDGRVIDGYATNGTVLATNVDTFGHLYIDRGIGWLLPLRKKDGVCTYVQNSVEKATTGVPSGSTPAASTLFLSPDGRIIDGLTQGAVFVTDVESFGKILYTPNSGGHWYMPLVVKTGVCK